MNRLATQTITPPPATQQNHESYTLPLDDGVSGLHHLEHPSRSALPIVFAPLHYERNYAYPLIVWLGGDNESGSLRRVMPGISLRNYVAISPQSAACRSADADGDGWQQQADAIERTACDIFASIEYIKPKLHINPDRVFVAGKCGRGTMALRIALQYPDAFAGVISLGGPLPTSDQPLRMYKRLRGLPVLLSVMRGCRQYSAAQVCRDLRLLHSAGLNISLRQYPQSDSQPPSLLTDVDRWIMEQIGAMAG